MVAVSRISATNLYLCKKRIKRLETDNFLGLNIQSYLKYDGKAFRIAIRLFFIFKITISIVVVHSHKNELKMTKKIGPGSADMQIF